MDSKTKIILRYSIAVFLGSCTIYFLKTYWKAFVLDKVACVALFSCIISVTGEDESLGPVLYKLLFRSCGVLVGGLSGYLLLYFPTYLLPHHKGVCLLVIPVAYITIVQYFAKWNKFFSGIIKRYKANHLLLQLQMAFGVIYVGSWDDRSHGFQVAVTRICAIWVGSVSLLVASLLVFPQTSLHLSVVELCECMHLTGKLVRLLCQNKIDGQVALSYDYSIHTATVAATAFDEQSQLLDKIEIKLNRVSALSPFLFLEPAWIPGLPRHLVGHKNDLVRYWCPFLAMLKARLVRIRATLTVMDSNIRIDSYRRDQRMRMKTHLGRTLGSMCGGMSEALEVVSCYIESPFSDCSVGGWKGSVDRRDSVRCNLKALRREVTDFTASVLAELEETNTLRRQNSTIAIDSDSEVESEAEDIFADGPTHSLPPNTATTSVLFPLTSEPVTVMVAAETMDKTSNIVPPHVPSRGLGGEGGEEHHAYHKLSPMRAFCNLAVQCAVQLTSILRETDTFIGTVLLIHPMTNSSTCPSSSTTRPNMQTCGEGDGLLLPIALGHRGGNIDSSNTGNNDLSVSTVNNYGTHTSKN